MKIVLEEDQIKEAIASYLKDKSIDGTTEIKFNKKREGIQAEVVLKNTQGVMSYE